MREGRSLHSLEQGCPTRCSASAKCSTLPIYSFGHGSTRIVVYCIPYCIILQTPREAFHIYTSQGYLFVSYYIIII
jgi:hypothetical protein